VQQAPAISRSSLGRTLGAAAWILGAAALAEIVGAGIALSDRARHLPPLSIQVPPPGVTAENEEPGPARPAPSFGDPFAAITNSTPKPAAAPPLLQSAPTASTAHPAVSSAALPQPTPVEESQVTSPESRLDGLLTEARTLRQRGDTTTSIIRLREALAISPKNTLVIYELATTYDKMGLEDKEMEQWRAIYDMGESTGVYYQLADAKLRASAATEPSPTPSGASGAPLADENGFQPGSSLALVNLSTDEKPETSEGYKRFTLKIPVKRRPDVKINVSNVVIQVFFYDQLGDDTVVRTNASVSSHWSTLPADWQNEDVEELEVDYTQAPPEPGKIEEGRHYYGYIVCVYYNKELQDQAADPETLIKKYPPPLVLPDK